MVDSAQKEGSPLSDWSPPFLLLALQDYQVISGFPRLEKEGDFSWFTLCCYTSCFKNDFFKKVKIVTLLQISNEHILNIV